MRAKGLQVDKNNASFYWKEFGQSFHNVVYLLSENLSEMRLQERDSYERNQPLDLDFSPQKLIKVCVKLLMLCLVGFFVRSKNVHVA